MACPKFIFEFRMPHQQHPCTGTLQYSHRVGNADGRRKTDKQVQVIRLNFQRKYLILSFSAYAFKQLTQRLRNTTPENGFPVLGAPYHMVSCLIDAVSAVNDV